MNSEKGSTFSEIILLLAVVALFFGFALCFYSLFHCTELDFTEEQRTICEIRSAIILFIGVSVIVGSVVCIFNRIASISKRKTKRN